MHSRPTLALLDGDSHRRGATAEALTAMGHVVRVLRPGTGFHGLDVDLVLLDLDMGGTCDVAHVAALRDATAAAILAMTASPDPVDRIAALEAGADDVVVGSPVFQEIAARVAGLLERQGAPRRELLRLEGVTVDFGAACLLRLGQAPERLGPGELALLRVFARNPDRVLSRDDLLDAAPADTYDAGDRAIDSRIVRLRRKLDTQAIVTVRRHGYMFVPPASSGSRSARGPTQTDDVSVWTGRPTDP